MMKERREQADEVADFTRRVFWLRSKIAHGARPIEELENLIIAKPDDEIVDNKRKKPKFINKGHYASLLIPRGSFPGFLVNVRELTRICIRFFCDTQCQGQDKTATIKSLDGIG